MQKDDLIARLKALGAQLGREVNLTGTKDELVMRVAELEEELDDDGKTTEDIVGEKTGAEAAKAHDTKETGTATVTPGAAPEQADGELVTVVALSTLHIDALHETENTVVSIASPDTPFRVSPTVAADLVAAGLVREL